MSRLDVWNANAHYVKLTCVLREQAKEHPIAVFHYGITHKVRDIVDEAAFFAIDLPFHILAEKLTPKALKILVSRTLE
jgi:hypothetical protein